MAAGIARLSGKVAIVTGAAQGIGRAIATRLAAEGARVAIADIKEDTAGQTAAEIKAAGGEACAVKLDVTSLASAMAAADRVERELGPIDILVNNAGWDKLEPFVESTPETWDRVIAINFRGVIHCCKAVIPRMQTRGHGKIVSIASDAGRVGSMGEAVYSGMQGCDHRIFENARAGSRAQQYKRQRSVPGAHRNRSAARRNGESAQGTRRNETGHPDAPVGQARRPRRSGRIFCLLRCRLRDRPGGQHQRRTYHGRMNRKHGT